MAAIGKIRSWGPVLATVIGLALFAFIAEEMFRSCEATGNERRQQVGEVLGKKISVQDFQSYVDEFQEYMKLAQNRDNFSEEELNQQKDQVWQLFVSNAIIEKEAEKLGLTVTNEEMQNILKEGQNPFLLQPPYLFVNQETRRFDVNQLTKFLDDYKKMQSQGGNAQMAEQYQTIYKVWKFMEKVLRQQVLQSKYNSLLAQSMLTNPVSAKMAFDAQNEESDVLLATIPYSSIKDDEVKVSDADLKAKYEEKKEQYRQYFETRDIKYVDFQVVASKADRDALMQTMTDARQQLLNGVSAAEVVRKAQSQIAYTGIAAQRSAFPSDIASRLDSMQVGQVSVPFETAYDNTLNVVKLINKVQLPDSVEFRMISVGGSSLDDAHKRADSIYNAINAGADFETLAKKYGQTGEKQWMTSAMYERMQTVDPDTKEYINALNSMDAGEMKNLSLSQLSIILQVTARKAFVTKYDVAAVKHTIDFSKATYSAAYNKFSQYVSENKTLESLEKNAQKFGFTVQERKDLSNNEHNVAGVSNTRDALKWIFDEAKVGEVSPLYACGNNDHLLVVALTGVNKEGYRPFEVAKSDLRAEALRTKQAEKILADIANVKSIDQAKAVANAKSDTIRHITFSAPAFVGMTISSEPALSGVVAQAKKGAFAGPVKGNGGVFMFQVINEEQGSEKFDEKTEEQRLNQTALQAASQYTYDLYQKAKVKDNRYLYF